MAYNDALGTSEGDRVPTMRLMGRRRVMRLSLMPDVHWHDNVDKIVVAYELDNARAARR